MSDQRWRKSRYCGASNTCVEVAEWRTAGGRCTADANCVEIGDAGTSVAVRDSADPSGPVLALTPAAWAWLVDQIREGR